MASVELFSLENIGSTDILSYNTDSDAALRLYCIAAPTPRFAFLSQAEIDEVRDELLSELDLTCGLSILAALEASFKVDYMQRCKKRLKDPLSKDFRKLHRNPAKKKRVSLEEDILKLWGTHYPPYKQLIGQFKAALRYRNWLAHGRYWIIQSNHKFDFQDLYLISKSITDTLPLQVAD